MTSSKENIIDFTITFQKASENPSLFSTDVLGGKGYNLIKLRKFGFKVPDGFFITTSAFSNFLLFNKEYSLLSQIHQLLLNLKDDSNSWITDIKQVHEVAEAVRKKILDTTMPKQIEQQLQKAWNEMQNEQPTPCAVRSSGTAEDTNEFSFAGQYDTYLNVKTSTQFITAVKKCWASLFTDRGLIYRMNNGFMDDIQNKDEFNTIPKWVPLMCVVVQKMVFGESAGVMFTADPLNNSRNIVTIDTSYGLGEALVSGKTGTDTYKVNKRTKQIEKRIGEKKLKIIPTGEGGTKEEEIEKDLQNKQVLEDDIILKLAQIGIDIEKQYEGIVQDIEWAIQGKEIYILQSRAVTSLYPVVTSLRTPLKELIRDIDKPDYKPVSDGHARMYICGNYGQMFLDPFRPLGTSLFESLIRQFVSALQTSTTKERMFVAGGRLYFDFTDVALIPGISAKIQNEAITAKAFLECINRNEFVNAAARMDTWVMLKMMGFVLGFMSRKILPKFFTIYTDTFVKETAKQMEDIFQKDLKVKLEKLESSSMEERITNLKKFCVEDFATGLFNTIEPLYPSFLAIEFLKKLVKDDIEIDILVGLEENVTTQMSLCVGDVTDVARQYASAAKRIDSILQNSKLQKTDEILKQFRDDDEGESKFKNALIEFLDKYGFRCNGEIDATNPRWRENPVFLLRTIQGNLKASDKIGSHREKFKKAVQEGYDNVKKIVEKAKKQAQQSWWNTFTFGLHSSTRAKIVDRLVRLSRAGVTLRESPKFYIIKTFELLRKHFLNLGKELQNKGYFTSSEDIFYLYLDETEELIKNLKEFNPKDIQKLIQRRRKEYERYKKLRPPPVLTHDGEDVEKTIQAKEQQKMNTKDTDTKFHGTSVSSGIVEGIARVVLDPLQSSLQKGEILVCVSTDPGWTPLFISAVGLVMEVGGMLTHGSVVAREMCIPAVVGVPNATKRIKSGQKIRVDGNKGVVEILSQ